MSSKRSQGETFHDFMAEISNLLYVEADIQSLSDRIYEAYEVGEISESQYDKLKRELDDYM
jgi:hypothetical protein